MTRLRTQIYALWHKVRRIKRKHKELPARLQRTWDMVEERHVRIANTILKEIIAEERLEKWIKSRYTV